MNEIVARLNDEMSTLVRGAWRSLVQVHSGRQGAGAGTILHPDGLIVTNAHVVQRQSPKVSLWDGRTLPAALLAYDERLDLAAVAVEEKDLPAAELGNSRKLVVGQWVVAMGHPWGVKGATTAGMIIDVGHPVEGLPYRGELIQIGLHLRPGHSGGPLLDSSGRVVGINTMISGPDVGLAVPVHTVKGFLKRYLGSGASELV